MDVIYSADAQDLDRVVWEAQAERPDRPIRVRLQPTLLRVKAGQTLGNHRSWPGVSWMLECQTAEEAIAVRLAMEVFFGALARLGAEAVAATLTARLRP
jgi:hypothetical protein